MKCAVVTIAIGEKYIQDYNQIFRKHTERYCKEHEYDFHLITEWLLPAEYQTWEFIDIQKWQIPFLERFQSYDYVMILDADIVLTPQCPPFHSLDLNGKVAMVNEYSQPTPEIRLQIQKANGWEPNATAYYMHHIQKELTTNLLFNGGLIICSPKQNGPFFKRCFISYLDGTRTTKTHPYHYEQANLSFELVTNNMYHILDNSWNRIFTFYTHPFLVGNTPKYESNMGLYNSSYGIHYAGKDGWELANLLP
jgi:hypothetical protein